MARSLGGNLKYVMDLISFTRWDVLCRSLCMGNARLLLDNALSFLVSRLPTKNDPSVLTFFYFTSVGLPSQLCIYLYRMQGKIVEDYQSTSHYSLSNHRLLSCHLPLGLISLQSCL